jgi:hypothetical protein
LCRNQGQSEPRDTVLRILGPVRENRAKSDTRNAAGKGKREQKIFGIA